MVVDTYKKLMKTVSSLVLFISFVFSQVIYAQTSSVVVLFGDSITAGFNSGRSRDVGNGDAGISGPTQFLSDMLNNPNQPRPSTVVNWGIGGSSSTSGVQRMSGNLAATVRDHQADQYFVMIMYGTNDLGRGIGAGTTAFNNSIMVSLARNAGYLPVVGTVTPRSDRDDSALAASIASAATSNGAQVVDQFAFFNARPLAQNFELELSFITGEPIRLHPNDDGYLRLVQNWFDGALQDLIPVFVAPAPPAPPPLIVAPLLELLLEE